MPKIVIIFLLLLIGFWTPEVNAQVLKDCPLSPVAKIIPNPDTNSNPGSILSDSEVTKKAKFLINVGNNKDYSKWKMEFECGVNSSNAEAQLEGEKEISRTMENRSTTCEFFAGNHTIKVIAVTNRGQEVPQCRALYTVVDSDAQCELFLQSNGKTLTPQDKVITAESDLTIIGEKVTPGGTFGLTLDGTAINGKHILDFLQIDKTTRRFSHPFPNDRRNLLIPTSHTLSLHEFNSASLIPYFGQTISRFGPPLCSVTFTVGTLSNPGNVLKSKVGVGNTAPSLPALAGGKLPPGCGKPNNGVPDPRGPAVATAIGCIHTNPAEFTKDLMKFVIGISGGLAFLMMLLGAFQILTSSGNPETLQAGRERLTSAIIGLLIVIFAILLLQIIGVGILDIPGFAR